MADALSQVMAHLGPEASASCLGWSNCGYFPESREENPAIIKGDQQLEQEVQVATGRNACH